MAALRWSRTASNCACVTLLCRSLARGERGPSLSPPNASVTNLVAIALCASWSWWLPNTFRSSESPKTRSQKVFVVGASPCCLVNWPGVGWSDSEPVARWDGELRSGGGLPPYARDAVGVSVPGEDPAARSDGGSESEDSLDLSRCARRVATDSGLLLARASSRAVCPLKFLASNEALCRRSACTTSVLPLMAACISIVSPPSVHVSGLTPFSSLERACRSPEATVLRNSSERSASASDCFSLGRMLTGLATPGFTGNLLFLTRSANAGSPANTATSRPFSSLLDGSAPRFKSNSVIS
mmetsp:Transcript_5757/g.13102  ORF Transcript_5757/g.13102 Transcript_5757/m.13102 type:complete len:298 (+) Transcript_5757:576-1469(+)